MWSRHADSFIVRGVMRERVRHERGLVENDLPGRASLRRSRRPSGPFPAPPTPAK